MAILIELSSIKPQDIEIVKQVFKKNIQPILEKAGTLDISSEDSGEGAVIFEVASNKLVTKLWQGKDYAIFLQKAQETANASGLHMECR